MLEKDTWSVDIVDELNNFKEDIYVDKYRISGFWDTPLNSILRNLGIQSILFVGVNTDQCVMATLQDAHFLGYDCILLEDCTATTSPDYCFKATLYNVKFAFGFVAISKVLLPELQKLHAYS